jgi:hypothetical protein
MRCRSIGAFWTCMAWGDGRKSSGVWVRLRMLVIVALPGAGVALACLLFAAPGRGAAQTVPFHIVLTNDS